MTFDKYGICLLGLASLAGCDQGKFGLPPPKQEYSVTLYGEDGTPIRTWVCDEWAFASQPALYRDGKQIARISGTYIIERID